MHSGSSIPPTSPAFSVSIGVAALVLEGRPLFDDEYFVDETNNDTTFKAILSPNYHQQAWSDTVYHQTPRSRQDSIYHLQRLRQKLHQLRSTPSTSRDCVERMLTVETNSPINSLYDSDDELEDVFKQQVSKASVNDRKPPLQKPIALSLQVLAATSVHTTPRSFHQHDGLLKTVESYFTEKFNSPSTSSSSGCSSSSCVSTPSSSGNTPVLNNIEIAKLKARAKLAGANSFGIDKGFLKNVGPHCDLFLKKVGLIKANGISDQSYEFDEHYCNTAIDNCFRWQLHYGQLSSVFARNEPICIEVYLGPENHVILLEQWIIQQTNGIGGIPMTLQSLCTAIRSQLYFSQITAWTDQLKGRTINDPEIKNNPRIKNASKIGYKPKLDILYRIRQYDSTSCFSSKPVEHNFPETMVAENVSVKVSLRSLPRTKSIPQFQHNIKLPRDMAVVHDGAVEPMILDDRRGFACNEKGKHRCPFDEESINDDIDAVPTSITSHRDKQLNKYKKMLQRRDKKKRMEEGATSSSIGVTSTVTSISNTNTNSVLACIPSSSTSSSSSSSSSSSTMSVLMTSATASASVSASVSASASTSALSMGELCVATSTSHTDIELSKVNSQYDHTINSIRPPLYSTLNTEMPTATTSTTSKCTQTATIVTATVATQTDNNALIFPNCDFCGIEMQYFCWNCDKKMFTESTDAQRILDKADLLLQAIKRTPTMGKQTATYCNAGTMANVESINKFKLCDSGNSADSNQVIINKGLSEQNGDLCCKRQKMVHNYFTVNDISTTKTATTVNNNTNHNNNNNNNDNCNSNNTVNNISINAASRLGMGALNNDRCHDDSSAIYTIKKELALNDGTSTGYRRTLSESVVGACISGDTIASALELDLAASQSSMNIITNEELKLFRRAYSEDELICNCDDNRPKQDDLFHTCDNNYQSNKDDLPLTIHRQLVIDEQCKTPTGNERAPKSSNHKINPLYISCRDNDNDDDDDDDNDENSMERFPTNSTTSKQLTKPIPKVNLTKLFQSPNLYNNGSPFAAKANLTTANNNNNINKQNSNNNNINNSNVNKQVKNDLDIETELEHIAKISMPISLSSVFNFDNLSPPLPSPTSGAIVQKSNSAPTFAAHTPALSPRFLKTAAAYKRRSRHLSDRSSIGSDEHISDEEFHQYACDNENEYRPGISPSKAALKLFPKNYGIRRRALLGSFEECLLQRRFEPKFLVPGYKVLLGASGCYCTTQITIPAYTFFYEINAETMSTPYVCEISMPPRKGYVVPRTGHVQATLLNPLGMVVRMFVVAYDFRDMPSMSQTFVRQRILSFDESANPDISVDDLSAAEQMKLLRYAIHLRFQTTRSGRLALHSDIRMLISRRTDCDTAAAHAKGALESPNELKTVTIVPDNPRFSPR